MGEGTVSSGILIFLESCGLGVIFIYLFIFKIEFYFIFSFIFISWKLITLQYCSGFCHILT